MIVLINLGTPKTASRWSVIKYLWEFLMDRYVIDLPFVMRFCLITFIIAPFRSKNTANSYRHIWFTKEDKKGSPLLYYANQLKEALQQQTNEKVFLAMRYGSPSIKKVIAEILEQADDKKAEKITFVPLYPHYALSTTETVVQKINALLRDKMRKMNTMKSIYYHFIDPFYSHSLYLKSLTTSILPHLKKEFDFILFSYHGLPESHLTKIDPNKHCLQQQNCCSQPTNHAQKYCYRHQVQETTLRVVEQCRKKGIDLPETKFGFSFQSRLGRDPWLQPATENEIRELAEKGIKRLLVVAPSFINDNLETLFEIKVELKDIFIEAGGEDLSFIPCLNAQDFWVKALLKITQKPILE